MMQNNGMTCPNLYWTSSSQLCQCPCHNYSNFIDLSSAYQVNNKSNPCESGSTNGVIKSEFDKRDYRAVTLANKLKVLLISDPENDKAAAAMCVLAGSMHDPDDIPGMAHFCEHMLFLGTEKYPEENSFGKFLSANAGDYNAFTQRDSTNYYFDVAPTALRPALDRFAELFISPLFSESAAEREVQAIASEDENNAASDAERRGLVDNLLCMKWHPYRKFDCGNVQTLLEGPKQRGLSIVDELRKFFAQHYSANLMSLVVLGHESCDELQCIVEEYFGRIENKEREVPYWSGSPYGPDELMTRVDLVPLMETFSVLLVFPVPDLLEQFKSGAINYVEHLLSQEGPGSLSSLLKRKHWSTIGTRLCYERPGRGFAFFPVEIELTEEGFENLEEVVAHFFQFVGMIREAGPQEWIWEEIRLMNDIDFKFSEKEEAIKTVGVLAVAQHNFPPNEVLPARYSVISEYKPELIEELLASLVPTNMRMITMAKSNARIADTEEEWHGARFRYTKIVPSLIKKWQASGPNDELGLPKPNPLLPTSLELKPRDNYTGDAPRLIMENQVSRVWFLQDKQYFLPQATMIIAIISAAPMRDPHCYNMTELLVRVVADFVAADVGYSAAGAGLSYTLEASMSGISIMVDGYDSKCAQLFGHTIKTLMKASSVLSDRFEEIKEGYQRDLENERDDEPYVIAMSYVYEILRKATWSNEKLRRSLQSDDPTAEQVSLFVKQLLARVRIEWLFVGNLTEEEAREIYCSASQCFEACEPLSANELKLIREGKREAILPSSVTHIYRAKHRSHWNSAALLLLQCGIGGPRETVILELIESIMSEPAYDILRTQEQLGYVVLTHARKSKGTLSLLVLIQGESDPAFLDERMDNFLLQFTAFVNKLGQEDFENYRSSFMLRKKEKPKTLATFAVEVFDEIYKEEYNFERQCKELEALQCVSLDEVKRFYNEWISPHAPKRKKLSVQVAASSRHGSTSRSYTSAPTSQLQAAASESQESVQSSDSISETASQTSHKLNLKKSKIHRKIQRPPSHRLGHRVKPHFKPSKSNHHQHKMRHRLYLQHLNTITKSGTDNIWPRTPRPQIVASGPEPARGGSLEDDNRQDLQPNLITNPSPQQRRASQQSDNGGRNSLSRHKSHHTKLNVLGTNFSSGRNSDASNGSSRRVSTLRSDMISIAVLQAASNMLGTQRALEAGGSHRAANSFESVQSSVQDELSPRPSPNAQTGEEPPPPFANEAPEFARDEEEGYRVSNRGSEMEPLCEYRRKKTFLLRRLHKKPSLTGARIGFDFPQRRRLLNRSRTCLLIPRKQGAGLHMKSTVQSASSSRAVLGEVESKKSMLQMWIDNFVKAAVRMAVGDKKLHKAKDTGPSILRDWVDNIVEKEIERAGHDLDEAEKETVRIQVYDAVRNSIDSLPGSKASKKSKKGKKKGKKGKKSKSTSGSSESPGSSRSGKRKRGKAGGTGSSTSQTPSTSHANSRADVSSGNPKKKKRIVKSPSPSPNVSSAGPSQSANSQASFTTSQHTSKKIPFQPQLGVQSPESSALNDSDYPFTQLEGTGGTESEGVSDSEAENASMGGRASSPLRRSQDESGLVDASSTRTLDFEEPDSERSRLGVVPDVLPESLKPDGTSAPGSRQAVSPARSAGGTPQTKSAEGTAAPGSREGGASPAGRGEGSSSARSPAGVSRTESQAGGPKFTSTPTGGSARPSPRGSAAGGSTPRSRHGSALLSKSQNSQAIGPTSADDEAQTSVAGAPPTSSNALQTEPRSSSSQNEQVPERRNVVISNIDEWKQNCDYYPLPPAAMLPTSSCDDEPEEDSCSGGNNNNNCPGFFHFHYCPQHGLRPCQGSPNCSLTKWQCSQQQQSQSQQQQRCQPQQQKQQCLQSQQQQRCQTQQQRQCQSSQQQQQPQCQQSTPGEQSQQQLNCQSSSIQVINVCPSICQRYLYHSHCDQQ